MSLWRINVEKNTCYLFFRKPILLQISTFFSGQKGCVYFGKVLIMSVLIMSWHGILIYYITYLG